MLCWNFTRTPCRRRAMSGHDNRCTCNTWWCCGNCSPLRKALNQACQTKPLTKQCASYVKVIYIFYYGKIGSLCSSTLNGVTEIRLHQLIFTPNATARGQLGTGLCKKLAVKLHWQTHSIFSPIHWTFCAAHTETWSTQSLPQRSFLFTVVVKQLLNVVLHSW